MQEYNTRRNWNKKEVVNLFREIIFIWQFIFFVNQKPFIVLFQEG